MQRSTFPQDFVWGAATASYQIEGAAFEDGRGLSIWDTFSRRPGAIDQGHNGDEATDHYHRVPEDLDLLQSLGFDAYRFSIAWPRIQPEGHGAVNQAGLDFYRRIAEGLLERGITPWATLYHWDLPQTLEDRDGWLNRDTAYRFAEYSQIVASALGDVIPNWITLNEPWCSSYLSYAGGIHAPGRTVGTRSAYAMHHLLLGHGLAMQEIRAVRPEAQAGITLNLYSVRAATDAPADRDAARRIDGLSNRVFLEPVLHGSYPNDVIADMGETEWFESARVQADLDIIKAPLDFLGVNYYSRHTVRVGEPSRESASYPNSEFVEFVHSGAPQTAMDWDIHPEGLVEVLQQASSYAPELPIYITENGSAFHDHVEPGGEVHDPERLDYLKSHLAASAEAIEAGVPLQGYFAWSLLDNFEWAYGYTRRFGIVHVNYETFQRTPKDSALWFGRFLRDEPHE